MSTLRLILGDQLTRELSALDGLDPAQDVILMAEVHDERARQASAGRHWKRIFRRKP